MKIQYWKSNANKQWYWRVVARNGKSVCVGGEGFKRSASMFRIFSKLFNAVYPHNIEMLKTPPAKRK